ncbi:MAG: hypothetical protein ACTSWY_05685 [Promethearchaeota archaeon]
MGKIGLWKIQPIRNEVILSLVRHKGEMLDTELLRNLENKYVGMNKIVLNRVLFNLEVEMIINVQKLRKNVNRIALRKRAPIDPGILNDNIN